MKYVRPNSAEYDPSFSNESVTFHRGTLMTTYAVLAVRRAVEQGSAEIKAVQPHLLKWAADPRMLKESWDTLSRSGGQAPGASGRRYRDIDRVTVWSFLRAISDSLRKGKYRRSAAKVIDIPKNLLVPSAGKRPIALLEIEDRVVQHAIQQLLAPLWDPFFSDHVFGFRRNRGRMDALAYVERKTFESERFVVVADDIRDAFMNVVTSRLDDVLRKRLANAPGLAKLVVELTATGGKRGIQQGGPLSPILLNLYLDHFLDQPWTKKQRDVLLLRYADDLLLICRSKSAAHRARKTLAQLLSAAGMQLKADSGPDTVLDLRQGGPICWLGYQLQFGSGELEVRIAESSWTSLEAHLILAHTKPNSELRAHEIVKGWISELGPCFQHEDRKSVLSRIVELARSQAFTELPSRKSLQRRWRSAHERWESKRNPLPECKPSAPVGFAPFDGNFFDPPFDPDENAETSEKTMPSLTEFLKGA